MPTIPHIENDIENLNYFRSLAVKASNNAVQFRIVERFLCEVERWLLKPTVPLFDVTRIKESIQTLKTATHDCLPSLLSDAEFQLRQEVHLWERSIEEKDKGIETYNFRRFCDSSSESLESEIFVALASFYKNRPYSHSSQSKFDLVITRLFTDVDGRGHRLLMFNAKEIARNVELALGEAHSQEDKADRFLDNAGAVAAIHSFITEAQGLDDFESLIKCRLFDRFREFKQELGEQFFEPTVIAAAVQCNVVFANAFNEMLEAANENLSESLTSDIDIPSALHDPSPQAQAHLNEALREFFNFEPSGHRADSGRETEHIWELLSLVSEKAEAESEKSNSLDNRPKGKFDVTRSAKDRLMPFLETLTKPEPDAALLLGQLNRAKSLQNLNLSDFLYWEDNSADMRSRKILGLILWSEEFLQNELGYSEVLTPTAQHEVLSLIQKSEEFATALRSDINEADEIPKSRLLVVLNALLESRLRLEGAIVRFTNRNLSQNLSGASSERSTRNSGKNRHASPRPHSSARWLLWLLLIAVLAAAAFYFYPRDNSGVLSGANATERIDLNRLADHESISNAYGRGTTMFVTANDSWTKLPTEKQKAILQSLLDYPGITHYESVVLRDSAGHIVGNISAYGVYVLDQAKQEGPKKSN
jgi:hypothetical protein